MLKCCEQRGSKLEVHQSSPTGKSLLSIQTFCRVSKRSSFSAQGWPDQASQQLCRLPHKGHKLLRLMLSREQRADDQDVAEKPQPVHFPPMEWAGAKAGGGRADPRGRPQCKVASVSGESGGGADIGPGRVEVAGSEPGCSLPQMLSVDIAESWVPCPCPQVLTLPAKEGCPRRTPAALHFSCSLHESPSNGIHKTGHTPCARTQL